MQTRRFILRALALTGLVLVAACGGGGGGGEGGAGGGGDGEPAPANSWAMDGYRYFSGGHSESTTSTAGDRPRTVAVVSTATTSGGDQANGKFSGSALMLTFNGTGAGVYNIVPSRAVLVADGVVAHAILVEVVVGSAVTTGSTLYTALSGTVAVTVDEGGKFHFDASKVPMARTLDVTGGVADAPATMTLEIKDAH